MRRCGTTEEEEEGFMGDRRVGDTRGESKLAKLR